MKWVHMVSYALVFIGGLNWGAVGFFQVDFVQSVFGDLSNLIYMLVGVATVYALVTHMSECKYCGTAKRGKR